MKLLYLISSAIILSGFDWRAKPDKIKPVLPLASDRIVNIPLLELALLENITKRPSKAAAKKNLKAIGKLRKKLRKASKNEAKMLRAELFAAYVKLHNHDVHALHGKIKNEQQRQRWHNRLQASRRNIISIADKLLPLAKSKKAVAHLLYHKHIARYFLADTLSIKRAIVDELAQSNYSLLPKRIRPKAQLLVALHHSPPRLAELRRYQRSRDSNVAIVAYLGEALALPQQRAKVSAALYQASAKVEALSERHKHELLVFSVKLWRKASGNKQDWNTPPLELQNFRHLKATRALIERAALSDWYQGRKVRAIDAYYKLAQDVKIKEYHQQLYRQYLLLNKLHTVEARNSMHFDDALRRLQRDYLAGKKKGERQPLGGMSADYLKTLQVKFVMQELDKAQLASYPLKRKQQAIVIAQRLVVSYPDQQVPVYEKVATAYTKMNAHERSAATWMRLVKDTAHKEKYLHRAIASQSTYLNYSSKPSFKTRVVIPAKHINDYRKLRGMYRKLDGLQPQVNWNSKAHLGLLLLAADKSSTTAVLWDRAIVADSQHAYAKEASAHLLDWYEVEQRWKSLEKISRLLLERKVDVHLERGDVQSKLATALLQQGIIAQQKGQNRVAIAKLAEYKTFKDAPRLDFVTWQLTRLYKKTEQYKKFFATLSDYAVNYPQAKHIRQALLEGGHYAGIMAEEEHAVYFYNRFLRDYQDDKAEPRVRKKLIALYQARGNFFAAIEELSLLQKSAQLTTAQRSVAAMQAIELEFRHGSLKNATAKIDDVIAANIAAGDDLGRVYYYKVTLTIGKRRLNKVSEQDYQQLLKLEQQITRDRDGTSRKRFFNDALALIALVRARRIIVPTVDEYEVLRSENITAYLQQKYADFNRGKATYQQVCKFNRGNICVTALYQLARFGEQYLVNIEKINIADTMSGHIVDPFVRKKNKMLTAIKNTIRHAHDTSIKMARSGKATPLVADQVTWLAKNALDFRNIERSNYFQFSK